MCRVTMGHLMVTMVPIGHLRVIMGHLRLTIGHLYANTTELHPKVRQTCLSSKKPCAVCVVKQLTSEYQYFRKHIICSIFQTLRALRP